MIKVFAIFSFLLLFINSSFSQDPAALIKEASRLEQSWKEEEALDKYKQALSLDRGNVHILCRLSEISNLIGRRQTSKDRQRQYYKAALEYAQTALKLQPSSSEANFVMSLAMGRLAQTGGGEQRINAVRDIRQYAQRSVDLDPKNYKGYHVLGKWHREVSNLNALEKWLVKVTYGGLPPASLEEAIKFYEKSKLLNPSFLLNYLELAKVYQEKNQLSKSKELLAYMLRLPAVHSDDNRIKNEASKLLKEIN